MKSLVSLFALFISLKSVSAVATAASQNLSTLNYYPDTKVTQLTYFIGERSGLVSIHVQFQSQGFVQPVTCSDGNCSGNGNKVEANYDVPGLTWNDQTNQIVFAQGSKAVVCAQTVKVAATFWRNAHFNIYPTGRCFLSFSQPYSGLSYDNNYGGLVKTQLQAVQFSAN